MPVLSSSRTTGSSLSPQENSQGVYRVGVTFAPVIADFPQISIKHGKDLDERPLHGELSQASTLCAAFVVQSNEINFE